MQQVDWLYREGKLTEVNDACAALYGFADAAAMVGHRLDDLMPRTLPTSVPNLLAIVRSNYCMVDWESVELGKNGDQITFLNNTLGEVEDGKLLRVWGTCRDITHIRITEQQARLHSAAIEALDEGCIIVDAQAEDMPVLYLNRGFAEITGYAPADILGKNPRILQGRDTDKNSAAQIRDAIAREAPCRVEILNYRKDGSQFWNLMQISPCTRSTGHGHPLRRAHHGYHGAPPARSDNPPAPE